MWRTPRGQIAALAARPQRGLFALADARPEGYSWREVIEAARAQPGAAPR